MPRDELEAHWYAKPRKHAAEDGSKVGLFLLGRGAATYFWTGRARRRERHSINSSQQRFRLPLREFGVQSRPLWRSARREEREREGL